MVANLLMGNLDVVGLGAFDSAHRLAGASLFAARIWLETQLTNPLSGVSLLFSSPQCRCHRRHAHRKTIRQHGRESDDILATLSLTDAGGVRRRLTRLWCGYRNLLHRGLLPEVS